MSKLHIVAPSRWLFNCISNSLVANKTSASISCIPNVIDVAKFIPMKKSESKEKLSLDSKRKYILFCAMDSANPYKGFKYLVDALSILENEEYEYIVMGKCDREDFPQLIRPKLHIMGFISKTEVLVDIYNASDILLITSVAENFPNVVLEAMACGVPVVGFDTGGIKDQVVHKETGILVKNFNSQGIAEGAKWILNNPTYSKISLAAREYVVNNYSFEKILDIHKDILNKN